MNSTNWGCRPTPVTIYTSAAGGDRVYSGLTQNCHSEERSDEESGAGLPQVTVNPPPQTPRGVYPERNRRARGDTLEATYEAKPVYSGRLNTILAGARHSTDTDGSSYGLASMCSVLAGT